jgi:lipopolysaccharide/colanic/teichoic acid biosynthesis glycosyltransferase
MKEVVKFEIKKIINPYNIELIEKNINSVYNKIIKRKVGLVLAIIILIMLVPIFLIISITIVMDTGFPIFYKAQRGGYKEKPFKIYKFRTMVKHADKIGGGTTALDDNRITRVGRFLRKTKLDEIPQLINIIKGEMGFIGPRPELLKYTEQYDEIEKYILQVRPGITDFSSIEFISLDEIVGDKNADEMYEKFVLKEKNSLRIHYVAQQSLYIDCKLFFFTILGVINKMYTVIFKKREDSINGVHKVKKL